ncbi:MmcQ/YjbR family DNA-binding protein [Fructobacillus sp. W13]|uniref:MmcQ/YjbR family DNA-binding protein n=1 Tax=Fructobacillus apis TaxID=2935017 RepID=A0ABT0ZQP3_9LACO|nr:MmcQ/YjbR family DNA-binding protein [Fructobacillus apis]MCO0832303.1 MmcQ/YjbR family DNA-binding protein [Fructobacillus apis]
MHFEREGLIDFVLAHTDGYVDHPFNGEKSRQRILWSVIKQKSNHKMIAMVFEKDGHLLIDFKLDPEHGAEVRELRGVHPGYHMNKRHWNTVEVNDTEVSEKELASMIEESAKLTAD